MPKPATTKRAAPAKARRATPAKRAQKPAPKRSAKPKAPRAKPRVAAPPVEGNTRPAVPETTGMARVGEVIVTLGSAALAVTAAAVVNALGSAARAADAVHDAAARDDAPKKD